MSEDELEIDGVVLEQLPNSMFSVESDQHHRLKAMLSKELILKRVRVIPGDRVKVVLLPYDLRRGEIVLIYPR